MKVLSRRRPRTDLPEAPLDHDAPEAHTFTVHATGQVGGDDGRNGHLAPAVHFACRMAAHLDVTLGDGPLRTFRVDGRTRIDARIAWGPDGECRVDASARPGSPVPTMAAEPHPDARLVVGGDMAEAIWVAAQQGTRSAAHLDGVVRTVHDGARARCTVLLDEALDPVRLFGEISVGDLAVLGTRSHGVLRGLGEPDVTSLTLTFHSASVLVLPLVDGLLLLVLDDADAARVEDVLARTRDLLARGAQQPTAPVAGPATAPGTVPAASPVPLPRAWASSPVPGPGERATSVAGLLEQRASRAARRLWGRPR